MSFDCGQSNAVCSSEVSGAVGGDLLGQGSFSKVYRMSSADQSLPPLAIKVSGADHGSSETGCYPAQALEFNTIGFAEFKPDSREVLRTQFHYLRRMNGIGFVGVYDLEEGSHTSSYTMDYIAGVSLREISASQPVPLFMLRKFLVAVQRCMSSVHFKYHGDLKPENIIVGMHGVTLIDPGFYGVIKRADGGVCHAAITTPAYYPAMNADDMFAIGLIAWEIITGRSLGSLDSEGSVGARLERRIKAIELTGNPFIGMLRGAIFPGLVKNMPTDLAEFACRCIGMQFDRGGKSPDSGAGFESLFDMMLALDTLL